MNRFKLLKLSLRINIIKCVCTFVCNSILVVMVALLYKYFSVSYSEILDSFICLVFAWCCSLHMDCGTPSYYTPIVMHCKYYFSICLCLAQWISLTLYYFIAMYAVSLRQMCEVDMTNEMALYFESACVHSCADSVLMSGNIFFF